VTLVSETVQQCSCHSLVTKDLHPATKLQVGGNQDAASQVATLKRWTEEALQDMHRPEEGERFFFRSVDPAAVSPEELFLSPVWERALSSAKTPLLVLE
jgi:hypothetical protein